MKYKKGDIVIVKKEALDHVNTDQQATILEVFKTGYKIITENHEMYIVNDIQLKN